MTEEKIKALVDACYEAKRIRELMPKLPQGVTPSYIHFLGVLGELEGRGERARISDISNALHIPLPGVTRTVKEMEAKGYVEKKASPEDGRVIYLTVTEAGRQLSRRYDQQYFGALAPLLAHIPEEDADCTVRTIHAFYQVMCEGRIDLDA